MKKMYEGVTLDNGLIVKNGVNAYHFFLSVN